MIETLVPRVPERQAPDYPPLLEQLATLRRENVALCAETAALPIENGAPHERVRELEARLGQTSANASRLPASDLPQAPAKRGPSRGWRAWSRPTTRPSAPCGRPCYSVRAASAATARRAAGSARTADRSRRLPAAWAGIAGLPGSRG